MSENLVTIVHQGGSTGVDPAEVDLEVLARAHIQLEAEITERARRAADAASNAKEHQARTDVQKAERLKSIQALAQARAKAAPAAQATTARPAGEGKPARQSVSASARVLQLKAAFPPKSVGTANVFIPRSGQGARSYILSSSVTNLPDGGNISTTGVKSRVQGRVEPFTYDVPAPDVWNWYRGMLQTTTLEALPRTLQLIEARLIEDRQKAQALSGGSSMSVAAQAKHTLIWFEKVLRPHLSEWRALLP